MRPTTGVLGLRAERSFAKTSWVFCRPFHMIHDRNLDWALCRFKFEPERERADIHPTVMTGALECPPLRGPLPDVHSTAAVRGRKAAMRHDTRRLGTSARLVG
jgi:hypothetical protein